MHPRSRLVNQRNGYSMDHFAALLCMDYLEQAIGSWRSWGAVGMKSAMAYAYGLGGWIIMTRAAFSAVERQRLEYRLQVDSASIDRTARCPHFNKSFPERSPIHPGFSSSRMHVYAQYECTLPSGTRGGIRHSQFSSRITFFVPEGM